MIIFLLISRLWLGLYMSINHNIELFLADLAKGSCEVLSSFCVHFETTEPTWTYLGRNVHWIVLYKLYVLFFIRKSTKETKGPQGGVFCFCMWSIYFLINFDDCFSLCSLYNTLYDYTNRFIMVFIVSKIKGAQNGANKTNIFNH